jgi:hypothetical protein
LSVMRASTVVKRQSRGWAAVLRRACQAATSVWRVATAGPRRARPWRLSTLSSISAMFNQRPCLGVEWLASRSARRLTSAGGNAAAREVGVCVFRVSMTSTIRADLRVAWGVGPGIALEDVLHSPAERGVRLGREAPLPLLPRLQLVFSGFAARAGMRRPRRSRVRPVCPPAAAATSGAGRWAGHHKCGACGDESVALLSWGGGQNDRIFLLHATAGIVPRPTRQITRNGLLAWSIHEPEPGG